MSRAAMQQALDLLDNNYGSDPEAVIDALRAALAQPDEYEIRADGERVRVDRWEVAIRRIVALLWGNRHAFEVDDVVEAVRALVPAPNNDDEGLVRCVLSEQSAPVAQPTRSHKLKTDSEVFEAVRRGDKTFEIRVNDRDFQVGDQLELHETAYTGAEMKAGQPLMFTGRAEVREVSHVLMGYGLMDGWCCLSFKAPQPAPVAPMTAAELLEVIGARDLLPLTEAICRKVEAAVVTRYGRALG